MKKLKEILGKSKAYFFIFGLTAAIFGLGILSAIIYNATRKKPGSGQGIDIDAHKEELENKIEEWQRYLDETAPPRRR